MNSISDYEYADGSGNRYVLSNATLRYIPVKPEESSTGMYSGGEPFEISLSADQIRELQHVFDNAILAQQSHTQDRAKMTGLIIKSSQSESVSVILKPDAPQKEALENALLKLKPKLP
jgi:hypothetical protein